jgi:hypothetical protein
MEDHIILHKSIIDDWKFKDEGVLKFWILLLVEELEAQKDEDGLFGIRSLTKIAKKVGVTRQTAHRLFKKMETVGDIELLCSYFRGEKQKSWNMNGETTTKISINRKQFGGQFLTHVKSHTKAPFNNPKPETSYNFADIKSDCSLTCETDNRRNDFETESEQFNGQFSTEPKTDPEVNITRFSEEESDNFSDNCFDSPKPEIQPPPTPEQEKRSWRRVALKWAIRAEVGILSHDESVQRYFNELFREYDGSPDRETQLAVRANFFRKVYGTFGNTLEIRKAELYAEHKHNPYVMTANTKKLCDELLDPEFWELSKRETFQYNEQTMIKVNVKGPRDIGDVAKELVNKLSLQKTGQFSSRPETPNNQVIPDSEDEKPDNLADTKPDHSLCKSTPSQSDPPIKVGTDLAISTNINIKNKTKNILSTVIENNRLNFVLDKRGSGGEKGKNFSAETSNENLPIEKKSSVAENHPDGQPAFSTRAFKSLSKAKQIQIIGERLNDLAELFPTLDVEFQFDHWQDWMSAKGQSFKDYSAAFRNWLRKSLDFSAKNTASNPTKIYTETGAKFVTQEVFTNPAHVPFKKDVPRNPNMKRRPGIGGV